MNIIPANQSVTLGGELQYWGGQTDLHAKIDRSKIKLKMEVSG